MMGMATSTTMKWVLTIVHIDGAIGALLSVWGLWDSAHAALALLLAGIAGGFGTIGSAVVTFINRRNALVASATATPLLDGSVRPLPPPLPPRRPK